MSEQIVPVSGIEQVLIGGDLAKLSPDQRVNYYQAVCSSLGLNPLTQPFAYITLNGKLTLYARKDAADQLRRLRSISISKPEIQFQDEWIIVTVEARDADGRSDSDVGVVNKKDMRGDFGNALMKAVTKAKRRVTLSICGLGMLDETEVETIPNAKVEQVEIVHAQPVLEAPTPTPAPAEPEPQAQPVQEPEFASEPTASMSMAEARGYFAAAFNAAKKSGKTPKPINMEGLSVTEIIRAADAL